MREPDRPFLRDQAEVDAAHARREAGVQLEEAPLAVEVGEPAELSACLALRGDLGLPFRFVPCSGSVETSGVVKAATNELVRGCG
ncbi:hypothetical protein GCM10010383_72260 [Streptomyces lomondensis]|uniref:Uncharacterized protein n=1 Tax=Streptomyces lomondensis TaxID=68229 RepID=A0ABQ2XUD0_9ACTN|nr:hypothetical protein GCM10010383_72260 [Streptomyces lomondensis]